MQVVGMQVLSAWSAGHPGGGPGDLAPGGEPILVISDFSMGQAIQAAESVAWPSSGVGSRIFTDVAEIVSKAIRSLRGRRSPAQVSHS